MRLLPDGIAAVEDSDGIHSLLHRDCVCILADDHYSLCGELAGGSVVVEAATQGWR